VNVIEGVEGYACANSTCFSLDGKTMYFGDSWGKWINEYDYDQQTGQVKSGKQFHSLKDYPSPHFPDGSVINSQG